MEYKIVILSVATKNIPDKKIDKWKKSLEYYGYSYKLVSRDKNWSGYNMKLQDINNKLEGLKDHRFSVVIENAKEDYYFTEKILDCFQTKTIPIFYGAPNIGDFFNINGILAVKTIDEIIKELDSLIGLQNIKDEVKTLINIIITFDEY